MYVFTAPKGKRVVLFGDVHFSYNNACPLDLRRSSTVTVNDLLRDTLSSQDAKLIAEYPYMNRAMRKNDKMMWYCNRIVRALDRNVSMSNQLSTVLHRVLGIPANVTGMLSKLYAEVQECPGMIAADIRSEPNVHIWDKALNLAKDKSKVAKELFNDPMAISRYMEAMLLCDDFVSLSKGLLKGTEAARYLTTQSTDSEGVHEIRRVYLRLSQADQSVVRRFASDLRLLTMDMHETLRNNPTVDNANTLIQTIQAYCMDTYIACILADLLHDSSGPNTILMYAGDFHTKDAAMFLKMLLKRPASLKRQVIFTDLGVNRCVRI